MNGERVLGVDACRAGWIGIALSARDPQPYVAPAIRELVRQATADGPLQVIAIELAAAEAARAGRPAPPARHAMQVWCGFADTREAARACLAPAMEAFYGLPFERFERYCPYGTADDVAAFLAPYAARAAPGST